MDKNGYIQNDNSKKIFAKNLNKFMNIRNKVQIDFVNDLDINKSAISSWCNGTRLPRMGTIQVLADYLNINISDLIEDNAVQSKIDKLYEYMNENSLDKIVLIPIYDIINLNSDWKNLPTGYTPFDFKIQGCSENKNYFYYKVSNNSMNIEEGTYILIEDSTNVSANDIILYSLNNKIELGIYKLNLNQSKDFKILGKYIK